MHHAVRPFVGCWLLALGLGAAFSYPVLPAAAQSDTELRRENDRLRDRVKELEAQIEALEARLRLLEEATRPASGTSPPTTPSPAPESERGLPPTDTAPGPIPPTPTIDDPSELPVNLESTALLIHFERLRYIEEFGANPVGLAASSSAIRNVQRRIDAWTVEEAKAWRKVRVDWRLVVREATRARDGEWSIIAEELQSDEAIKARDAAGDPPIPVRFTLKSKQGDRMRGTLESGGELMVSGLIRLNLRMDPDRAAPGAFRQNQRPYIGPFCDAVIGLSVESIEPAPAHGT